MSQHSKNGKEGRRSFVLLIVAQASVALLWMWLSSVLILLNQHLMVRDGFHFPMFLSGMGMAFSSVAALVACLLLRLVPLQPGVTVTYYMQHMMPVGLLMAGTLACGNLVYLYLDVGLIQMLKAFTPVITMLLLFAVRMETPTRRLVASVALITLGTMLATYQQAQARLLGLIIMFSSEVLECSRLVVTQHLLQGAKYHPIESLMYLAPSCAFWMVVGVALFEWDRMQQQGALRHLAAKPGVYLLAAALGFCVNLSCFFTIKLTSSLTVKILGQVKNTAVVVYAAMVLHEAITLQQTAGYTLGMGGFLWYTHIQASKTSQQVAAAKGQEPSKGGAATQLNSSSELRVAVPYQKLEQ